MTKYIGKLPEKFSRLDNDSIRKNRKEKHYDSSVLLLAVNKTNNIQTLIETRFYETNARSYCCVWLHLPGCRITGGDYAGGGGYHKKSTSFCYALINANIPIEGDLDGKGDRAIEDCLMELGKKMNEEFKLGLNNFTVIKTHA